MNKNKLLIYFLILLAFLILPLIGVLADTKTELETAISGTPLEGKGEIPIVVGTIIQVILGIIGIIFLVLLIYGGFVWGTAAGDSAKVQKAKSIIIAAVIGLVIIIAAYAITTFALEIAGIEKVSQ